MIGADPAAVAGAKLSRTVLRRVWRFARPTARCIAGFLAIIVASSLISLVPPLLFREILDQAIPEGEPRPAAPAGGADRGRRRRRRRPGARRALPVLADRRGPHLRPAGVAVRPRAAHADLLLHPHADRRADQPAEQRRASARSGPSPARSARWCRTSSCWPPTATAIVLLEWRFAVITADPAARCSSSRPSGSAGGCRSSPASRWTSTRP